MLYRPITEVASGDINGRNIYGASKTILVKEDIILTVGMITKLKKLGISGIFVKSKNLPNIEVEENVSQETKIETLACLYYVVDTINSNQEIDLIPIRLNVEKLIQEIELHKDILVQFIDIRSKENEVFIHTLQVCIVATTIATKLGITKEGLKTVTTTALLHEMIKNDNSKKHLHELNKMSAEVYALFREMKQKIMFYLTDKVPFPPYKRHKNNEVQLYAEILAIADCIDNLSSQFSKYPILAPYEAIEFMMTLAGKVVHIDVMNAFIRTFSLFPNGHSVKLDNGKQGLVVRQNPALPTRPVVGVFEGDFEKDEAITLEVQEFDLSTMPTVFITEMISPNSIALEEEKERIEKEKFLQNID
jgi:5'-deoxynucleotidase YfbR-like HD superfamily hydrolase